MENRNDRFTDDQQSGSQNPSESGNQPDAQPERKKQQTPQEGSFRDVHDTGGRKESFGDDYEVEQEDRMTEDEAKSEKANRNSRQ